MKTYNSKDQIIEKEYRQRENNYKLVFSNDENAKLFVDWLRSTNSEYEVKILNETVCASLREKHKGKIEELEKSMRSQQDNLSYIIN